MAELAGKTGLYFSYDGGTNWTGPFIRVANVNEFPGHIVCDSASKSEIVVPLVSSDSHLLGVLGCRQP